MTCVPFPYDDSPTRWAAVVAGSQNRGSMASTRKMVRLYWHYELIYRNDTATMDASDDDHIVDDKHN